MIKEQELIIWGRSFKLPIQFECYPGEVILPTQTTALEQMIANAPEELAVAKQKVETYLIEQNPSQFSTNALIDNIFRYVVPKSIYLPHIAEHCMSAILCHYRFDPEHGLAIVFENGKYQKLGSEDIAL